jgi:hypothetical protein
MREVGSEFSSPNPALLTPADKINIDASLTPNKLIRQEGQQAGERRQVHSPSPSPVQVDPSKIREQGTEQNLELEQNRTYITAYMYQAAMCRLCMFHSYSKF